MAIPQFTVYPSRDDPDNLEADTDTFFNEWPAVIAAMNSALATVDAATAGGALSLPYTFNASTTDADPGNGQARFNNANLALATVMRLDLVDAQGLDMTAILDSLDDSTSTVKAQVRVVKASDVTKWASFNVLSMAVASGYRNFTVQYIGGSGSTPFTAPDTIVAFFSRTGDKGDTTSNTAFTPLSMPALDMDVGQRNYFKKTIATNSAFTFSGIPAGGSSWTLELKLDGGSVSFPANVRPVEGAVRGMSIGKVHRILFVTSDGGTNVGMVIAPNFAA